MLSWLFRNKRRTVLIAWELGGGLGHVRRLLPIARNLSTSGHRVVFALRNRSEAIVNRVLPGSLILRAPAWQRPAEEEAPSGYVGNYAHLLSRCGYESLDNLEPLILGWWSLFDEVKPALIVCDHSPSVVLAASGRIPVVQVGSGFATPPSDRPFVTLHPPAEKSAKANEAQVLKSINAVRAGLNSHPLENVPALFADAETFTCCLPELDPYRAVRSVSASGPLQRLPQPQPLSADGALFGYLTGLDRRAPAILASLVRAKLRCRLFIREATPELYSIVERSEVTLFDQPQDLPVVLARSSAILHHGGLATTEMALAVGRPQFLLPRHLEQSLTADAVQKLGCGLNLGRQSANAGDVIRKALQQTTYADQAQTYAAKLTQCPTPDVLATVIQACSKHLA